MCFFRPGLPQALVHPGTEAEQFMVEVIDLEAGAEVDKAASYYKTEARCQRNFIMSYVEKAPYPC